MPMISSQTPLSEALKTFEAENCVKGGNSTLLLQAAEHICAILASLPYDIDKLEDFDPEQVEELEAEVDQLQQDHEDSIDDLKADYISRIDDLEEEIARLEDELQDSRGTIEDLRDEVTDLEYRIEEISS